MEEDARLSGSYRARRLVEGKPHGIVPVGVDTAGHEGRPVPDLHVQLSSRWGCRGEPVQVSDDHAADLQQVSGAYDHLA